VGTPAAELIADLGPEPGDLVSARLHGVSPFTGTDLDTWLRNLGVETVVATGVSVNLGVLGLAIEAVNLGYRVVIPRDTVAGIPHAYADALLENTYPLIPRAIPSTSG
jgi:nicotinamidase-related amidase